MNPIIKTFAALSVSFCSILSAQGAYTPLKLQGLDQNLTHDVRSAGMGGTVIASGNNAAVLFSNPAGLTRVSSFELRVSGDLSRLLNKQTQRWVPNRYFTGLSLMMEDSWGNIKSPMLNDTTPVSDPYEQLQKPFDKLGPNWSRTTNSSGPLSVAAAVPLKFDDLTMVFGLGGGKMIDLNYYYQNNNVTDPLLGRYRPYPITELQPSDTLRARWYQSIRSREGEIWGVTPAFGISYKGFSAGVSATYYTGSSDDMERRLDRGFLTFLYNRFKVQDTVRFTSATTGTSDYSGLGVTLGFRIEQPTYTVGASFRLPYTITREYSSQFTSHEEVVLKSVKFNPTRTADSVRTTDAAVSVKGKDEIAFPLSYGIGVMLRPFERWTVAFDIETRTLNQAEVKSGTAAAVKPWLSSPSFSLGAEYRPWTMVAFRCGYYEKAQVFEPEGAAIIGEPAMLSAYTFGTGTEIEGIALDLAYEYSALRYQDMWQSNINVNGMYRHRVMAEVSVRL
jgi:opacity protein-like surface antigen